MPQLDWNTTLSAMRENIPKAQFMSWIEPIEFIQSDETSVRLGVPSRFHEEMLRSHLKQQLVDTIQKQVGKTVQLEFEILVQKENIEASFSPPKRAETPSQPTRPTLRVIEGSLSPSGQIKEFASPLIEEREVFKPNFPKFTSPYIAMDFNHVAVESSKMFCDLKSSSLNSLVLIAGVGMGKTHLLSEIGHWLHEADPGLRVRYTNSETFTSEMIQSFRDNTNHEFKKKYREETDVLLFDDVHNLSNREKTQEQILHIFNELLTAGRRIVFSSSIPPQQLQKFSDPLRSRLLSMMSAEVSSPGFEERSQLLAKVCEESQMVVDPQVLKILADHHQKDIRELIGTLFRLHLRACLENRALDSTYLTKQGVGFAPSQQKPRASLEEVLSLIELNYNVSRTDLVGPSRKSAISWPRQVAMYLSRHVTVLPLETIGSFYGRDHATVIHAYTKVTESMKTQRSVQLEIEYLLGRIATTHSIK